MAFQAEAVRSPLQGSDKSKDTSEDASEKMPKKDMKKKKEHKKESSSSKETSKSKKTVKHSAGAQDEMSHRTERKKEADDKKESKGMSRVERQDKKKKDDDQKHEEMRNKKRSELEKRMKQIEEQIDELEDKKAVVLKEEEEDRADDDKEAPKSHVINHGSVKVDSLDRGIKNHKEMLAHQEKKHARLSNDTREDKRNEHRKRASLAKIYENNQRDLRADLTSVEGAIKELRVEEVETKNELQDDRPAHEELLMNRRHAETMHDSAEAEHHGKMLLAKESDEMKALLAKQKHIREELAALTKKINANDKAREEAAREAGIAFSLRKERHKKEVDRMIKEGVSPKDNHARMFTETTPMMQHRKEDVAHEKMMMKMDKDMSMRKGSMRSSKSMKKDMDMMGKKDMSTMMDNDMSTRKRPMPMKKDMDMMMDKDMSTRKGSSSMPMKKDMDMMMEDQA